MTGTITLDASAVGGTINAPSGNIAVPASGRITVPVSDAAALLAAGCKYVNSPSRFQALSAAPRAGSAGRIVASTSFANGTLSIANQPDVPRVLAVKIDPGTLEITAGNLALTYTANDGTTQVDNIDPRTAASTILTTNTSKGAVLVTSAIITAVAGGATPGVQIDDTNSLSLQVDPGFAAFTVKRANVDGANETIGTVNSSAASITPNTTPNATHTYGFYYNYTAPDS